MAVCPDVLAAALALHGAAYGGSGGRGESSQASHGTTGGQIVTLNAEMTMAARANPELGAVIAAADLVIPDGAEGSPLQRITPASIALAGVMGCGALPAWP